MSINWVMLDPTKNTFVRLPGEQLVYKSPARTSLSITTPPHASYPGQTPLSIQSSTGVLHLTNQRIIYLPATPAATLQSFSAPLLNLHDSHVIMPWFGSNSWQAVLQPVPGGNISTSNTKIEVKFVFNEGGAADFHSNFERIKERFQQALEVARSGNTGIGAGYLAGVNLDAVHLDQLPSYESSGQDAIASSTSTTTIHEPIPQRPQPGGHNQLAPSDTTGDSGRATNPTEPVEPPSDAPPGYEETQQQSIQQEFERRFSDPQ